MDRAQNMDKAFLMAKLFRPEYYNPIGEILESMAKARMQMKLTPEIENQHWEKFKAVCEKAKLTNTELLKAYPKEFQGNKYDYVGWLWNYLKNYDSKYGSAPDW